MKTIFTLILCCLCLTLSPLFAQDLKLQAERETRQMAEVIKMNRKDYQLIKKLNQERLAKIAALSQLREQDRRYLDLRLDQIEEEYAAIMFNNLNKKQYQNFIEYRREQPFTYAALTMKYNMIAQIKE